MNVNRIMVPLDGSMIAERALAPAAELARAAAATLVLVRAVEAPNPVRWRSHRRRR